MLRPSISQFLTYVLEKRVRFFCKKGVTLQLIMKNKKEIAEMQ